MPHRLPSGADAAWRGPRSRASAWSFLQGGHFPAPRAVALAVCALAAVALIVGAELFENGSTLFHVLAALAVLCLAGVAVLGWRSGRVSAPVNSPVDTVPELVDLLRDKEAAEAANAAKSRYLANVSHEIRSPLNAIYGYAQLVEHEAGVDPQEAARVIRRSAEHLTNLVEGLLDISLVENGVLRVNSEVVRLPALIDQIVSMFRPSAAVKGLAFRCELPERLPEFVRTDQKRLRQVLINLLSNAIKFTETGTVTLRVAWSGQTAVFEVIDTGPGIAEADRERIFTRYERAGESGRPQDGAGLGLAITRAILQILGGTLELDSTPGQGSCFRVRLMLGHVAGYRETSAAARRVIGYEGHRRSVLVTDDDPEQRALMRRVLEGIGFEVTLAPDGATALALSDARAFDLVLLDVSMPGLSGWEVAARLRRTRDHAMGVIMLSANAHERHGPDTGARDHDLFLVKPIEFGALVDAIGARLKLEWIYEGDAPAEVGGSPALPLSEAAREHVEKLRELLRIGHVRGMEAEIRKLEAAQPDARELVEALYNCLDRFDLSGLAKTLEGL